MTMSVASLAENHHWQQLTKAHQPLTFMYVTLHLEETVDSHWPLIFAAPCTWALLSPTVLAVFPHHTLPLPPAPRVGASVLWSLAFPPGPNGCLPMSVNLTSWVGINLSQPNFLISGNPGLLISLAQNFCGYLCLLFLRLPLVTRSTSCVHAPLPHFSCCSSNLVVLLLTAC